VNTKDRQRRRDAQTPSGRASNAVLAAVALAITLAAVAAARALGH
jgi:hypothetical protein